MIVSRTAQSDAVLAAAALAHSIDTFPPDFGLSAHPLSRPVLFSHPSLLSWPSQHEKAYQKQDGVFIGKKKIISKQKSKGFRYYKSVGLGFKTPKVRSIIDLIQLPVPSVAHCLRTAFCLILMHSPFLFHTDRHRWLLRRQEVPLHGQRVDSRPYRKRLGDLHQDAEYRGGAPRLLALCVQVPPVSAPLAFDTDLSYTFSVSSGLDCRGMASVDLACMLLGNLSCARSSRFTSTRFPCDTLCC